MISQNSISPVVAGYAIVLTSSLAFAFNNVFAVLSYEGGATPLALLTCRVFFLLGLLALWLKLTGSPIMLPRRARYGALGLGLINGLMSICIMTSFQYIAVGLSIVLLYIYPIFTGLLMWISGMEKLNRWLVFGLVAGFLGVALALEYSGNTSDYLGMALAGSAAVFMAITATLSTRVVKTDNVRAVSLHMHVSACVLITALALFTGDFELPVTTIGWTGFLAVPLFYTVAFVSFFAGIPRLGAVRTSLVMNLEPIASIALGFAVLAQALSLRQLAGAAIVIVAITIVKWMDGRKQ